MDCNSYVKTQEIAFSKEYNLFDFRFKHGN